MISGILGGWFELDEYFPSVLAHIDRNPNPGARTMLVAWQPDREGFQLTSDGSGILRDLVATAPSLHEVGVPSYK